MPVIKTTKELVNYFRFGVVSSTLKFGCTDVLYSRPFLACIIRQPSICSICSNHIKAFLLYLLLQLYPPSGIKPMVSGFRNLSFKILLHADAMVKDLRNTSMLPISINSLLKIWQACLKNVTSSRQYSSKSSLLSNTVIF